MNKHLEAEALITRKKFEEILKLIELGNHILKHQWATILHPLEESKSESSIILSVGEAIRK